MDLNGQNTEGLTTYDRLGQGILKLNTLKLIWYNSRVKLNQIWLDIYFILLMRPERVKHSLYLP